MEIEQIPAGKLFPYINNSRTHSDDQVLQIAASIQEFGFTNPVLIDGDNGIIAGHGRLMAAKKLGLEQIPCVRLEGLTDAQKKAYVIADNRIALNAGWDGELLKIEVSDLSDGDFDLSLLGFEDDELKNLLDLDDGTDDIDAGEESGIDYQERYSIVIECDDEEMQRKAFEELTDQGYECKVLVN